MVVAERPSWDDYFLGIATAVAARADCRRSKVGAVLVDVDRIVIATGYNGVDPGASGCLAGLCPRGLHSYEMLPRTTPYTSSDVNIPGCIAKHAEANAVRFATSADQRLRLNHSTCYITRDACAQCFSLLHSVGIERIVYPNGERWMSLHV